MISRIRNKVFITLRHKGIIRVKKNANPLRWGVLGLGNMAEIFSSAIDGSKDDIVFAVASRDISKSQAFASNYGRCKAYGSYKEMVHDDNLKLDVIYIATPVKYHYDHIKLCLEAGRNVICEKPITSNTDQFTELIEIAKKNNCFFMEGMWMKCLSTFQKAVGWINSGKIGTLDLIKVDFYKREQICEKHTIYNAKEGGGVLRDFGVYAVAFMTYFLGGEPEKLSSHSRKSVHGLDADWQIYASRGKVNAFVNISSNFAGLSKAALIGQQGTIEWDSQFNRTNRICLYDSNGKLVEEFKTKYKFQGFEFEVAEVNRCIRGSKKSSDIVSIRQSEVVLRCMDKLCK